MTRGLLAGLAGLALLAGAAEARQPPPKHPSAHRRALARDLAAARRHAAAKRKQLAQALALAQTRAPAAPATSPVAPDPVVPVVTPVVEQAPPVVTAPLPRVINITARDNTLTPSRTLLGAGDVYVEFVNRGEDPHDLHVALDGHDVQSWPVLAGWDGLTTPVPDARTVALAPGSYRLYCALHTGMETAVTVSG